MDFEQGSGDLSVFFKIANFAVAGISVLCGLSQLFMGFQENLLGLYLTFFGAGVGLLEFQVPPKTYEYASFLFSFSGRGFFYTLMGAIIAHDGFVRITLGLLVFGVGIMYLILDRLPGIAKPENMNIDALSMGFDADADLDPEFV